VPVLATRRRALAPALADSSRGSAGRGRARLRRGLVATQFALSLALVFVALLLVRTLYNLRTLPTGFATDSVAVLAVTPEAAQFSLDRTTQYLADAEAALRAYPGVRAAGIAQVEPLDFGGSRMTVTIPGYDPPPDEDMELNYNRVSAAYFDAMGIAPLDGRAFTSTDAPGAPLAMIVNETMARRFWGDERAVGRAVLIGKTPTTVVGVVPDVKYRMLREAPRPSFYLSAAQSRPRFASFHVRSDGPPAALLDGLRRTLAAVDPAVPITRVRTLRDQAAINVNDERLAMTIAAALAGAAMLLAAVGLYGAMAFAVGQRAREIGIRMALGAVPADVRQLVLRQGIGLALAGSVAGVGLGLGFARAIEHRLFGVAATDALSILLAIFGLAGIAAVAAWVPARRAARVDPVRVLRT
jgi:predicted permease